MKEQLEIIRREALAAMDEAADSQALEALRVKYLGKKGELTAVLKQMGKLSPEERPVMGQVANAVRADIEEKLEAVKAKLAAKALEAKLQAEAVDVTIPGVPVAHGPKHPLSIVLDECKALFVAMGVEVVEGPAGGLWS